MGNCLSHDPLKKLKKNQLALGGAIKQCSKNKRVAFEINNEENVPVKTKTDGRRKPVNNNAVATGAVGSGVVCSNYRSALEAPKDVEELQQLTSFKDVNIFTYKELIIATDYFRPDLILGEGGFGLVYKGVVDENVRAGFKSTKVAVKELNPDGYQGDREWLAEVNYLGHFTNPNLVKLIGYCCEDKHRLLVYEYMACGSLETHLFRRHNSLTWPIRMNIALDAAKGLAFLHGAERPIIYRDFKTSNILLDSEFNAKLSDFGLAKEGPMGDQTHVSTRVMGTYGYAAPEYIMTGHLTARSDVYGFGVVLLEILVGKRALDKRRPNQEHNLVEWARPLLIRATKLLWIIDPKMQGQYSTETASKISSLAYRCLSENPKSRPTMSEVVKSLETYNEEERLYQVRKASEQDASEANFDSSTKGQASSSDPSANKGENSSSTEERWRTEPGGGRSISDPPPKDFDHRHSPSPEPAAT